MKQLFFCFLLALTTLVKANEVPSFTTKASPKGAWQNIVECKKHLRENGTNAPSSVVIVKKMGMLKETTTPGVYKSMTIYPTDVFKCNDQLIWLERNGVMYISYALVTGEVTVNNQALRHTNQYAQNTQKTQQPITPSKVKQNFSTKPTDRTAITKIAKQPVQSIKTVKTATKVEREMIATPEVPLTGPGTTPVINPTVVKTTHTELGESTEMYKPDTIRRDISDTTPLVVTKATFKKYVATTTDKYSNKVTAVSKIKKNGKTKVLFAYDSEGKRPGPHRRNILAKMKIPLGTPYKQDLAKVNANWMTGEQTETSPDSERAKK